MGWRELIGLGSPQIEKKPAYSNNVHVSQSYIWAVEKFLDTEGAKELFKNYEYSSEYHRSPLSQLKSPVERLYVRLQRVANSRLSSDMWGKLSVEDILAVLRTNRVLANLIAEVPEENCKEIEELKCAQRFFKLCVDGNKKLWADIEKRGMGVAWVYSKELDKPLDTNYVSFQLNPDGKFSPCSEAAVEYSRNHKSIPGCQVGEIINISLAQTDISLAKTKTMLAVG